MRLELRGISGCPAKWCTTLRNGHFRNGHISQRTIDSSKSGQNLTGTERGSIMGCACVLSCVEYLVVRQSGAHSFATDTFVTDTFRNGQLTLPNRDKNLTGTERGPIMGCA